MHKTFLAQKLLKQRLRNVIVKSGCVVIALCLWAMPSMGQAQTVYSWSGISGGAYNSNSNWTYVSGVTASGATAYPGGSSNNDTAELNTANNTVVFSSAIPNPLGTLSFGASSLGSVNEFDFQLQTPAPGQTGAVTGLTVTNLTTLGSGVAGAGTEEIFLDPEVAGGGAAQITFSTGLSIVAGGVLEMGSQTAGANNGSLVAGTVLLNGGVINADRSASTGSSVSAAQTFTGSVTLQAGTLTVGNMGPTSNAVATTSSDGLYFNSNFTMTGGSIVAGTDSASTSKPSVNFTNDTTAISGGTLSNNLTYVLGVGNDGNTHTFRSDIALANFQINQSGTYADGIGAYTTGGTLQLGSLTIAETHATTTAAYTATVKLLSNVAISSGGSMLTANNSTVTAPYYPTNQIDLAGYTLDLTAVGTGSTTFTPNNSQSNTWAFESSTGTGTVKAYAFDFHSAYKVTASSVNFQAAGGNGTANNLSLNNGNGGTFSSSSTFVYSGGAAATNASTLIATATIIGGLTVQAGYLNLNQTSLVAGGAASVTGTGGLILNGTSGAAAGTLTVGTGLGFTLSSGGTLDLKLGVNGNDEILGNGGISSGGNFTLNGGVINLLTGSGVLGGGFNFASTYQIFNNFAASGNGVTGITFEDNGVSLASLGESASINQAGDLSFMAVPEPSTWAMLIAGSVLLLIAARRRTGVRL